MADSESSVNSAQIEEAVAANNNMATEMTQNQFKQFDIVTDYSDHYYCKSNDPLPSEGSQEDCFKNVGSSVHKKIMQEWKILENNLPESIFVRVYEGRIDLLRAVIIGASGTPYHDGLFFFDIAFPPDYPNMPPQVHYHSHGLELNPNLYESGYVCLSLLNTWGADHETEKWNPASSTILQVLVSLQALVLNEKPYYNEPGCDEQDDDSETESSMYSEEVFVLSCKTMMFLLQNPPKNFEGFVEDHFRKHASAILAACNAYTEGRAVVGYFECNGCPSSSQIIQASSHFKETMETIYSNLDAAFKKNGASMLN